MSPNSSKDEKSAYKRAIKGRKNGGLLLQKGNKLKLVPKSKDQATKDSILVNKYNDQEIQSTKPGNYKQKNGKTVWVPDRTKAPYKKEKGGDLILKGQDGLKGLWRNTKEFVKSLGSFSELPAPIRYDNDSNTYSQGGIYKYRWSPKQKEWEMVRGFDGMAGTKNYKGRNSKFLGMNVGNLPITPSSSTFSSYNDGTTEFRNDGTVWHKGKQIK